jgi:hypothetical protein
MQIILEFSGSPEQYVDGAAHKEVRPPPACPACGGKNRLGPLGYYPSSIVAYAVPGRSGHPIVTPHCSPDIGEDHEG